MGSTNIGGIIHVEAVGIARRLDTQCRLIIPSEFRRMFQLRSNTMVEIIGTNEGLLVRPAQSKE